MTDASGDGCWRRRKKSFAVFGKREAFCFRLSPMSSLVFVRGDYSEDEINRAIVLRMLPARLNEHLAEGIRTLLIGVGPLSLSMISVPPCSGPSNGSTTLAICRGCANVKSTAEPTSIDEEAPSGVNQSCATVGMLTAGVVHVACKPSAEK